ncbi:MAG: hypothetical protein M1561_03870 [Gammaproteobacteria bacterium]|nr:hypothetical protein [Gammaproteobacteria bacterium]
MEEIIARKIVDLPEALAPKNPIIVGRRTFLSAQEFLKQDKPFGALAGTTKDISWTSAMEKKFSVVTLYNIDNAYADLMLNIEIYYSDF